jgi:MFS transporter, PHS family, inorganic phosphate transporter
VSDDACDLFVIGIVVYLLKSEWSLSTTQVSWLNSATLLASAAARRAPHRPM